MNYTRPVMLLTGKYVYNYSETIQDNTIESLFTFVITDWKVLESDLIPMRIVPYLKYPKENVNDKVLTLLNSWFANRIMTCKRKDECDRIRTILSSILSCDKNARNIEVSPNEGKKIFFFSVSDKYWLSSSKVQISECDFYKKREKMIKKLSGTSVSLGDVVFSKNILLNNNCDKIDYNGLNLLDDLNYCVTGVTNKRWIFENNELILCKQRSVKYGQDPINEYLATVLLGFFNIPNFDYVKYSLDIDGYDICSKCKNFISDTEEFVPMAEIVGLLPKNKTDDIYTHIIKCAELLGMKNATEYFIDCMIMFDRKTLNFDRHLNNFGFQRDVTTGKITKVAPLFDLGGCFFNNYDSKVVKLKNHKEKPILFSERAKKLENSDLMPKYNDEIFEAVKKILSEYEYMEEKSKNDIISKVQEMNEIKKNKIIEYSVSIPLT